MTRKLLTFAAVLCLIAMTLTVPINRSDGAVTNHAIQISATCCTPQAMPMTPAVNHAALASTSYCAMTEDTGQAIITQVAYGGKLAAKSSWTMAAREVPLSCSRFRLEPAARYVT